MAFCSNCGSNVAEGTAFCASCGSKVGQQQPANPPAAKRQLHCPQCKGVHITPVVESSVDGALTAHSSNGRMSSTKMSNTHRNYWMCSTCGNKFRNIQNLEEEIVKTRSGVKVYIVFTVICLIATLYFGNGILNNPFATLFFGPLTFGCLIGTIVAFCLIFSTKKKVETMTQELQYLKTNCFD